MMIKKENLIWIAIKTGLLSGVIAIFLCLIGMIEVFSKRDVIEHIITLGDFILLVSAVSALLVSPTKIISGSCLRIALSHSS